MRNLKPGCTWLYSHQIFLHAMFIAGYDLTNLISANLKGSHHGLESGVCYFPFLRVIWMFLIIDKHKKPDVFFYFGKLEDTLCIQGNWQKHKGKNSTWSIFKFKLYYFVLFQQCVHMINFNYLMIKTKKSSSFLGKPNSVLIAFHFRIWEVLGKFEKWLSVVLNYFGITMDCIQPWTKEFR